MLQLTKRVDYALIALTHLALQPEARISARELASTYELSQPLVANVLKALARGALLESVRGTKGGYRLAVPAERLTVGRVAELLEGPLRLTDCISDSDVRSHQPTRRREAAEAGCCLSRTCPVRQSVFRIHLKIRDVLYGVSVAELARASRRTGESLPTVSLAEVEAARQGAEEAP